MARIWNTCCRFGIALLIVLFAMGCQTYQTSRVAEHGSTRGYPFIFQKAYLAKVTYTDGTKSAHIVGISILYAVDIERAPLGTTKGSFENSEDGFALKSEVDLDQKTPENITAITELLKTLGVSLAGAAPTAFAAPPVTFMPDLDPGKQVATIELVPIG